jgi:uncharacterized protein (TIRG00374 family)
MEFLRRRLGLIFRTLVSLLLILWLVRKIDWVKFWAIVRTADVNWLLAGFVCFIPVLLIVSWRWRLLLAVHDVRLRYWRIFELTMIGQFFSAFLLGTTGGDVIKIFYVARAVPSHKAAVGFTVIVDRVIGMVALLLFGVLLSLTRLPLFFSPPTKVYSGIFYLFALGGVVGSLLACLGPVLLQNPMIQALVKRLPLGRRGTSLVAAYETTARAFSTNLLALVGSLPSHVCTTLIGYCILRALHLDPPLLTFCALLAMVNMLIALPISISGIGLREFLFVNYFGLVHIDLDHATAFSLTYFTLNILWSLVGGPFYFLYRHETHTPAPPADVAAVNPIFSER